MSLKEEICTDCGSCQPAVLRNRGYGWVELVCWMALVVPGLMYSIWRRARRRWVCPYCGNPSMVSVHSPRARRILSLMQYREIPETLFEKPLGVTDLKPPKRRAKKKRRPPPPSRRSPNQPS